MLNAASGFRLARELEQRRLVPRQRSLTGRLECVRLGHHQRYPGAAAETPRTLQREHRSLPRDVAISDSPGVASAIASISHDGAVDACRPQDFGQQRPPLADTLELLAGEIRQQQLDELAVRRHMRR